MNLVDVTIKAQLRQTENLIKVAGREIDLHRPSVLVDDGAGGKKRLDAGSNKLGTQRLYLGGVTSQGRGATTQPAEFMMTSLGDKYKSYFVLIGMPGDNIEQDDYFFISGEKYVVLWPHGEVDQYQKKFTVGLEQ